ncbi:MAG: DUF1707 domain-containing protein [Actinomycetota bacterium]|nr:DUF1707 domain-containing protein [Actinomycetota bacterium]
MHARTNRGGGGPAPAAVVPSVDPRPARIGDAEREAAAGRLNRHYALGRLSMVELEERLDATFAAVTAADLDAVLADLPPPDPAAGVGLPVRPTRRGVLIGLVAHALAFVIGVAAMWSIWLLTWTGHPWPIYPTLGWLSGLTGHALAVRGSAPDNRLTDPLRLLFPCAAARCSAPHAP